MQVFKRRASCLALLIAGFGFGMLAVSAEMPPMPVASLLLEPQNLPQNLQGVATLKAQQQVRVSAETDGRVVKINFRSGETVAEGDLLVQLNDASEQAQLKQLEAQLLLARRQLKRSRSLENISASQAKIEEDETRIAVLEADSVRTRALIELKQLRAPFSGVLGVRKINLGEYLKAGSAVVSLTDTSQFFLNIMLAEQALGQAVVGQAVSFKIDALPGRLFKATVSTVEPVIDEADHTLRVQATVIPNGDDKLLRPGLFARAQLHLADRAAVLMIPEVAVLKSSYGDLVYVISPSPSGEGQPIQSDHQRVEARSIVVGQRWQGQVEVLKGLQIGDRIVISGQNRLRPGSAVQLKDPAKTPARRTEVDEANDNG